MRLFLKIFLAFWLALVLACVVAVGMTVNLGNKTFIARWRHLSGAAISIYAQTAAQIYDRRGTDALDRYLERVDGAASVRAYLFRGDREVSRLGAPPNAVMLSDASAREGEFSFLFKPIRAWVAQPVTGPSGHHYVLVTDFSGLLPAVRVPFLRIMTAVLVAGLVCFWLARNVAGHIGRIRSAAVRLASGELSARVGPAIGRRGDEIGDLGRDFDQMAGRLETLVNAQSRILADISHELRSPLARLNVALGLARRSADPQTVTSLDRIEREAVRLDTLIGQLSTLSLLESGARVRQQSSIDLGHLLREIVADANYESEPNHRSVRFSEGLEGMEPRLLMGDPELLHSAFDNVIRNAVRYTPEDTIVEVSIKWTGEDRDKGAVIKVRDHGPGIPENMLQDIFRPFFRIGESRDRKTGGVGLGLAIAEQAVRLHGGRITAMNRVDGGLEVEICLPEK